MDCRVALVTVSVALLETMLPNAALMVVEPTPTPVANPSLPTALLMGAIDGVVEVQIANGVRSWVEASS